jgi:thiamine biosynthesis protein ThiS
VEIVINGQSRGVADGLTVAELLDELNLADKHVAVEVNLELVPHRQHTGCKLAADDKLEIVTLVGGG